MAAITTNVNNFYMDIAKGKYSQLQAISKFGSNPDIDTANGEDIWDYASAPQNYTFTASGGTTYYFSSSNAADTQTMKVFLLVEDGSGNWLPETVNITLVGQTQTAITATLGTPVRIYRAYNTGTTAIQGTVYFYENDTVVAGVPQTPANVRAVVNPSAQQTLMAIYTVPYGFTGYLKKWYTTMNRVQTSIAQMVWRSREKGGVFRTRQEIAIDSSSTSQWQYEYVTPIRLPAETDILVRADTVTANNTGIAAGFDIILEAD